MLHTVFFSALNLAVRRILQLLFFSTYCFLFYIWRSWQFVKNLQTNGTQPYENNLCSEELLDTFAWTVTIIFQYLFAPRLILQIYLIKLKIKLEYRRLIELNHFHVQIFIIHWYDSTFTARFRLKQRITAAGHMQSDCLEYDPVEIPRWLKNWEKLNSRFIENFDLPM